MKKPYGGITNVSKYLLEQYGEKGVLVKRGRSILMNQMSMEQISGRRTRNCSVVAVARVVDYYRQTMKLAGIPEDILYENKETCIRIPMNEEIRSLNLSNSAAIVLYEALRQTGFKHMQLDGKLRTHEW